MFVGILALTAFIIAGVAAYFSVQGIATLYAGAFISVLVMAGSLEVGKLVATSFLYRYWHKTTILLKTYLLIAVMTLMGITSMGIFGFLTSAYQSSLVEFSQAESQQNFMVSQKAILQKELDSLTMRVETLNQSRLSQEKRLPEMSRTAAKPVYEDIAKAGEEISQARTRMNQIFEEIKSLDLKTLEAQKQSGQQKDIGTLKYAAELFNTDINTIVKWFTLAIIVVFDPLAIALVLSYNVAINRNFKDEEEKEEIEETKTIVNRSNQMIKGNAKYRG
ncbi:hypothetical protein EBU94_00965 [bacterium]|nr:hypothetical protein [bacterium]